MKLWKRNFGKDATKKQAMGKDVRLVRITLCESILSRVKNKV